MKMILDKLFSIYFLTPAVISLLGQIAPGMAVNEHEYNTVESILWKDQMPVRALVKSPPLSPPRSCGV